MELTQRELKRHLHYNPATGVFTRRIALSYPSKVGEVAGTLLPIGYVSIRINGRRYYAHRLAWLYVYGEFPIEVDHRNENRRDNRISNLLSVSRSQHKINHFRRSRKSIRLAS
jgi:hypothetical protein